MIGDVAARQFQNAKTGEWFMIIYYDGEALHAFQLSREMTKEELTDFLERIAKPIHEKLDHDILYGIEPRNDPPGKTKRKRSGR